MLAIDDPHDPFTEPRDAVEDMVNSRVRDFFLASLPSTTVFRQNPGGYALIAPQSSGARGLTVPAANEADFMFHGTAGDGVDALADFIAATIVETGVDHLRLPLLSERQARILREGLAARLPAWIWADMLSAVSPIVSRKPSRLPSSFRRAIARLQDEGIRLQQSRSMDVEELQRLHERRWGAGNRSNSFFQMLRMLMDECGAQLFTARAGDGTLLGAQLDIPGGRTRHFYYCVSDKDALGGLGTAVMGASWSAFLAGDEAEYSFGRGTERYKYRYADSVKTLFELRGFLAPVVTDTRSKVRNRRGADSVVDAAGQRDWC